MRIEAPVGVPIVCSLVSLVLAFLVLFAGKSPNFMEDYHIVMLNTSELGKNLVPTPTIGGGSPSSTADCNLPGFLGKACSSATAAVASAIGTAVSSLDGLEDDLADKLAAKLGIQEFYSLHVMDACEGNFSPNATAPGATTNVTKCTTPLKTAEYNVTALFDHELSLGPLQLNLASLGFTKDLQDAFDIIPKLLLAMAIFYILAVAFTGLSFLGSLAGLVTLPSRAISLGNFVLAALAVLTLLIGNLITTAGLRPAAQKIDDLGKDYGLRATVGGKFMALIWSAFALMVIAAAFWVWEFFHSRKRRVSRRWNEKHDARSSTNGHRRP